MAPPIPQPTEPAGAHALTLRSCIHAAAGHVLVSADYSQLEVRLLAHFVQDPALLSCFRGELSGSDLFSEMSASMYKKPLEEVTPEDRNHTKHVVYGILYGMSETSLAKEEGTLWGQQHVFGMSLQSPIGLATLLSGISIVDAREMIKHFHACFQRVRPFTEELVAQCKKQVRAIVVANFSPLSHHWPWAALHAW